MKVHITDVYVTDDGHYRVAMVTDDGVHIIELDRENALRFMRELFNASLPGGSA